MIPGTPKEVTGLGQTVAGAFTHPTISFRYQPGKFKRIKKGGPKVFVPNVHFPEGVFYSFPAWLAALVGIPVLITAVGGLGKILSGIGLNTKEKSALERLRQVGSGQNLIDMRDAMMIEQAGGFVASTDGWKRDFKAARKAGLSPGETGWVGWKSDTYELWLEEKGGLPPQE